MRNGHNETAQLTDEATDLQNLPSTRIDRHAA